MTVGIHKDVPPAVYHRWDCCSHSRLKALERSAMHCKHAIENPPGSAALVFGEALHLAVFEPDRFDNVVTIGPTKTRASKAWREAQAEKPNHIFLTACECARLRAIVEAISAHPKLWPVMSPEADREVSLVWQDVESGLMCKGRTDLVDWKHKLILDLKTCRDASPRAFSKSIFDFAYHRQGAMYLDGWQALGKELEHFAIVAVEKEPPHGVALYWLEPEALTQGRAELSELKQTYAECLRTGKWPGYPARFERIGLPRWAKKRENDE